MSKAKILKKMCIDEAVYLFFRRFQKEHPGYSKRHPLRTIAYLFRLDYAQYNEQKMENAALPKKASLYKKKKTNSQLLLDSTSQIITVEQLYEAAGEVIVSMTSYPGRIQIVSKTIKSLLSQSYKPKEIILWLSEEQFQNKEADLPESLLSLTNNSSFKIKWTKDDLKPHKKYFYTVELFPDLPIVIVDDDMVYDKDLIAVLMNSYYKHPNCISCIRANLMMFNEKKEISTYSSWEFDYKEKIEIPTFQLLPTGVGGVLYPPRSIPKEAFDKDAINRTCLLCDDLWLKVMTVHNGYRTVIPMNSCKNKTIPGSQDTALWKSNIGDSNNDKSMELILNEFEQWNPGGRKRIIDTIYYDKDC